MDINFSDMSHGYLVTLVSGELREQNNILAFIEHQFWCFGVNFMAVKKGKHNANVLMVMHFAWVKV